LQCRRFFFNKGLRRVVGTSMLKSMKPESMKRMMGRDSRRKVDR
jgi:hypothetical protein